MQSCYKCGGNTFILAVSPGIIREDLRIEDSKWKLKAEESHKPFALMFHTCPLIRQGSEGVSGSRRELGFFVA